MVNDWTSGYVADIGYTYGYYAELNPLRAKFAITCSGFHAPAVSTACELGFGQGMSINLHAASSGAVWYGTDFNPSQAALAQEIAASAGAGAQLFDQAFDDFARRDDLPEFDFIGLHGIWSWVSAENQGVIVDFLRRKLRVGGVLYISYNTLPGWGSVVPLRHLLTEHAATMATGRGIVSRIDAALEFAESLIAINPVFARASPLLVERFGKIKGQSRHYLAHEYFNRDWTPIHFAEMSERLTQAKLSYVCSAHFHDHVDLLNMTAEQQEFLTKIPDPLFKQTVRDFVVNQGFRRDYWIKGPRPLSGLERAEALRDQRIILGLPRDLATLKLQGGAGMGELSMAEAVYNPILDVLAEHRPLSLGEIEQRVSGHGISAQQVLQAVLVLLGKGDISLVQEDKAIDAARPHCDAVNRAIQSRSRGVGDFMHLASPVIGGGVEVGRVDQLFMAALAQGSKQPEEWAAETWRLLKAQGQKLVSVGGVIESDEDNLTELTAQARSFAEQRLPVLKALGIN